MRRFRATLIALLASPALLCAQSTSVDLERLDPGVEDVGPLGTSYRVPRAELRTPSSFESVYRAAGDGSLVRISGAIVAKFFRSEYVMTRSGDRPVRPAGTVFYIGAPDDLFAEAQPDRRHSMLQVSNRVSLRSPTDVDLRDDSARLANRRIERPTWASEHVQAIWTDAEYRAERLGAALGRALRSQSESRTADE